MDWEKICKRMEWAASLLRIKAVVRIDTGPGTNHRGCVFWNGEQYVIWLRPNSFFIVSDFCHELAHILLGHVPKEKVSSHSVRAYLGSYDGKVSAEQDEKEKEADRAGEFILQAFREAGIRF